MATDSCDVAAVVVTHHPDTEALGALIAALGPQVAKIVLVDNGSGPGLASWLASIAPDNLTAMFLKENRGLAAAQNIGIAEARRREAGFVLLSDQDSLPEPDMVARLRAALNEAQVAGRRPAAAGPRYHDAHQGRLRPFVRIAGLRVRRFDCECPGEVFQVDHLIASGTLIPLAVLDDVGNMNEALFIDFVDTEWCLRAWRKGYTLLGVCDASMRHGLGDRPNYFLGRYVPVHSPLRHYYLCRNAVWLMRQPWLPWGWRLATLRRLALAFAYFTLFGPRRRAQACMMSRGLRDGMRGRLGPAPDT